MTMKQKKVLYRIIIAVILLVALSLVPVQGYLKGLLFLIPYIVIGYDILRKALAVMLFYQIGELFQSVAVGKSRRNISALMDIRPDYANVEDEQGNLEQVDPEDVEIGAIIVVRPGERIPIDGEVVEGSSSLNTSALTGESVPREVLEGDAVISGCVNINGL